VRKNASSLPKAIVTLILGALFGIWLLYSQVQQDSQRQELKSVGQSTVGNLTGATRHSVNFIPMGYSFQISYAGQSKQFDVSKSLFYSHINDDGKFRVNERIPVIFIPNRPNVAELPEMLDLLAWWCGGPLVKYSMGTIVLLGSLIGMVKLYRYRQNERLG